MVSEELLSGFVVVFVDDFELRVFLEWELGLLDYWKFCEFDFFLICVIEDLVDLLVIKGIIWFIDLFQEV